MPTFPRCRVCDTLVIDGAPCLTMDRLDWFDAVGPVYDNRHYAHLACAIRVQREKVRLALLAMHRELVGEMLVEVARLAPDLADEVASRVPLARRAAPLDDPDTFAILE